MQTTIHGQPKSAVSNAGEERPHFGELPNGYRTSGEWKKTCLECCQVYHERSYVDSYSIMHTERTLCGCGTVAEEEFRQKAKLAQDKADLRTLTEKLFGAYDILKSPKHADMSFQSYVPHTEKQKQAYDSVFKMFTGDSRCLCGHPGRGKTHLAVAKARHWANTGRTVLAMRSVDLTKRLQDFSLSDDENLHKDAQRVFREVDLMVIDDIGMEKATAFRCEELYNIIDYRISNHKSLIVTTNLGPVKMREQLGNGMASRLLSLGGPDALIVLNDGEDARLRG